MPISGLPSSPPLDSDGLTARIAEVTSESRRRALAADELSAEARRTIAHARQILAEPIRRVSKRR